MKDYKDNGVSLFSEVKKKKTKAGARAIPDSSKEERNFFRARLEWLHRGALGSPSLEVLKTQLDKTLSYVIPGLRLDVLQRYFLT